MKCKNYIFYVAILQHILFVEKVTKFMHNLLRKNHIFNGYVTLWCHVTETSSIQISSNDRTAPQRHGIDGNLFFVLNLFLRYTKSLNVIKISFSNCPFSRLPMIFRCFQLSHKKKLFIYGKIQILYWWQFARIFFIIFKFKFLISKTEIVSKIEEFYVATENVAHFSFENFINA
jgi:hypothetical protein